MQLKAFFDSQTSTLTYVVWDEKTKDAVIIDPVLNYDPGASSITQESIRGVVSWIKENNLVAIVVLETHAHADHLSGAQKLKSQFPSLKIGIGENIKIVQSTFKDIYHLKELKVDGSQFDFLLKENQEITFGSIKIRVISTPGHTPACCSYLIEDLLFTGDALFMPDFGVGRCDFPDGSAEALYHSVSKKLYSLPDSTRTFTGHDYQPNGRKLEYESTIGQQKEKNIHINATTQEKDFVQFRKERDSKLSAPKLLFPSIQVNINAGNLPPLEENGTSYLKIPIRQ